MTCFYPREALLPHKMLNARMPEKRERTRYKLCNGSCVPNRGTSPSIRKCFCLAFFCLVFSLPVLAFFLKENFRLIGRGPGRGRSELLPRPGGGVMRPSPRPSRLSRVRSAPSSRRISPRRPAAPRAEDTSRGRRPACGRRRRSPPSASAGWTRRPSSVRRTTATARCPAGTGATARRAPRASP